MSMTMVLLLVAIIAIVALVTLARDDGPRFTTIETKRDDEDEPEDRP